ncbi:MAG: HD-GYP domain-containing protein [Thermodesulfobacteriota bacterium]
MAKAVETRRAVIENISGYPRLTVWTGAGRQEEPLPTPHKAPPKPPPGAPLHWIEGLNTIVVFPLIGREGCLGLLLSVYAGEKGLPEFASRDREVWDGISYQVSIALDEARLYKDSIDRTMELSRKIETIQMMHEIDNAILSALEPGEILDTAASMVAKAVYCEMTAIFLVDKEKSGFRFAAGFGTRLEKGFFMPFDHSSVKDVLKTGIPQYVARFKEADGEKAYERSLVKDGIASRISVPLVVKGEVTGVLSTCSRRAAAFSAEDLSVVEKLSSQIGIALENARLLTDIEELFFGTVKTLSEAIDAKSPWTRGHSERVTELAMAIGRELGLGKQELRYLELAGLLHDIGKLGTYESILDKPGRLTEEEQEIMKQHPAKGAEILSPIKQMAGLAPAIKHHHEFYDGTGYPAGLKGEEIPFMARILTVADTVDAMGADRPYRKGKPMSAIVAELKHCSGTQFDPLVVDTFLRIQEAGGARAGA